MNVITDGTPDLEAAVILVKNLDDGTTVQVVRHVQVIGPAVGGQPAPCRIIGWEALHVKAGQQLILRPAEHAPGHAAPSRASGGRPLANSTRSPGDAMDLALSKMRTDAEIAQWDGPAREAIETFGYDQMQGRQTLAQLAATADVLSVASPGTRVIIHGHGKWRGGVIVKQARGGVVVAWCTPNRPSSPIVKRYRLTEVYPNR